MWRSILSQHYKLSIIALDNRSRILYCVIIIERITNNKSVNT